jgi:hypothetical protein
MSSPFDRSARPLLSNTAKGSVFIGLGFPIVGGCRSSTALSWCIPVPRALDRELDSLAAKGSFQSWIRRVESLIMR